MTTLTVRLQKWFSQPQDIVGLATWAGTFGSQIAQYITNHNVSLPTLIGGGIAGLIAIVIPNGSIVGGDVGKLVVDAGTAIETKNVVEAPTVLADAEKLAADLEPKTNT